MTLGVRAPVSGAVVAMADVPDPVFAGSVVGPGIAIDPSGEEEVDVLAPVDGTLVKLHPHAFVVVADGGTGVLVHLGLDTVQLRGEGFTLHVAQGDAVTAGQRLVTWNPRDIAAGGRSAVTPVVALETDARSVDLAVHPGEQVTAGALLFTL